MIVRPGRIEYDTELGRIHVDRQLDAAQLSLVVSAVQAIGWPLRLVVELELSEAGALVTALDADDDGRVLVDRQRVQRVRFGAGGATITSDDA